MKELKEANLFTKDDINNHYLFYGTCRSMGSKQRFEFLFNWCPEGLKQISGSWRNLDNGADIATVVADEKDWEAAAIVSNATNENSHSWSTKRAYSFSFALNSSGLGASSFFVAICWLFPSHVHVRRRDSYSRVFEPMKIRCAWIECMNESRVVARPSCSLMICI